MSEVLKALFNRLRSKNTTSQAYPDGADKLYFSFSASISQGRNYQAAFCALYKAIYGVSAALPL